MLFYLGLFVIFFLGSLKFCLPYLPSRLQSKKIKQLLEMGNIDKVRTLLIYRSSGAYNTWLCTVWEIIRCRGGKFVILFKSWWELSG